MGVLQRVATFFGVGNGKQALLPGEDSPRNTEVGNRTTPEQEIEYAMERLEPNFLLRGTILEIRDMDQRDARVKKIHERTARAACKGGLMLKGAVGSKRIQQLWTEYLRRLDLNRAEKLESDMRGAIMEGSLPIQWVVDMESKAVMRGLRMPTETFKPLVTPAGQFINPMAAYEQWDWYAGKVIARFPLWQLNMVRIRPDNYDNWGCFGRPYLDATRTTWRQLVMTEKDLVVRRHTRAPQRFSHVLEGATQVELETYENKLANRLNKVTTDFFQNRKGGATALQGDANLEQIADVVHLLDTFFSGAPAPKGLFGYVGDLSRDILEDLKRDYYDELDALQDTVSFVYELGFRLDLLLRGINPDSDEIKVEFIERRTETPNQRADLALKYQALLLPREIIWRTAGQDPAEVRDMLEREPAMGPYPMPNRIGMPAVSVTPGNGRKGDSATSVTNGAARH